ncbi:hypothetical protein KSP39_PZI001233 [Platanthera zijinensis]|uniref:Uncharacterized protein n=1 Tax=Platanthera zijinensis TaxID=2320716 RepID=A0AAP0C2U7_9ASPA
MGTEHLLVEFANHIELSLGVDIGLPCTGMECGDIIYCVTLQRQSDLILTAPCVALASSTCSSSPSSSVSFTPPIARMTSF